MNQERLRSLRNEGLTYLLAALGAGIAYAAHMPLALLVGPVIFMSILSQRFTFLKVSKLAYALGLAAIGVSLGQYFTPELIGNWRDMAGSLALNLSITILGVFAGYFLLRKVFHHDSATSALAGLPGGILTVIEMARTTSADVTAVLFFQVFRIVLGASMIPLAYALVGFDVPATGVKLPPDPIPTTRFEILLLVVGSLVVLFVGRKLKIPSAEISAPLALSAVLFGSGIVEMTIPLWVPALGFIVVGGAVGTMLPRPGIRRLMLLTFQTATLFCLFMGFTIFAATIAGFWLGIPVATAILTFAPASLTEMIALAVALDFDPTLVAANNMFRMLVCSFVAPLLPLFFLRFETGRAATSRKENSQN